MLVGRSRSLRGALSLCGLLVDGLGGLGPFGEFLWLGMLVGGNRTVYPMICERAN